MKEFVEVVVPKNTQVIREGEKSGKVMVVKEGTFALVKRIGFYRQLKKDQSKNLGLEGDFEWV